MNFRSTLIKALAAWVAIAPAQRAWADPCGMVPPIYLGQGKPIERSGLQKTYVFYKDGIETFVIRPGFVGKVEEFGMLIPFPSPPSIRKVDEDVFSHVAAAIDPPEVLVDLKTRVFLGCCDMVAESAVSESKLMMRRENVTVLREEAVGMYEVAVLQAGSASALSTWMEQHGYKYPARMDATCGEYVEEGWCFVAVKARVGSKSAVDARPGMRDVTPGLPAGATFDGHVQAMGFRFKVDELVVPMRLSAFNEGSLRNVVYLLSDQPYKISGLPDQLVVRQIPGHQLLRNVTDPLPLRILGGSIDEIPEWRRNSLPHERDPAPHNGIAKRLFAADLLAAHEGRLTHAHEISEKDLLRIGEELGIRGPASEALIAAALEDEREKATQAALQDLAQMTMTVIDGDLPREHIAAQNLKFEGYVMPTAINSPVKYDATQFGPSVKKAGIFIGLGGASGLWMWIALFLIAAGATALARRGRGRIAVGALVACAAFGLGTSAHAQTAAQEPSVASWVAKLGHAEHVDAAVTALVGRGERAVLHLAAEAIEGHGLRGRGWALVCLSRIGGDEALRAISRVADDTSQPALVRSWALAAKLRLVDDDASILAIARATPGLPAVQRPLVEKLLEKPRGQQLLEIAASVPFIQQQLAPAVLGLGEDTLINYTLRGANDNVRRTAAAYLATAIGYGEDADISNALYAYRFEPGAVETPWHGGALFIPSVAWGRDGAFALTGQLVRWHLWCDRNSAVDQKAQVERNLRSIQLMQHTRLNVGGSTAELLRAWRAIEGDEEVEQILLEQGVHDDLRYR